MSVITLRRKSLILSPKIYQYILVNFGNESDLASICFEDILTLRIYIDMLRNPETPEMSTCTRKSIVSIFNTCIEAKVAFKPKYLDLLRKSTSLEIIKPFFENFLPSVFGMKPVPKASKSRKSNNTRKRRWFDFTMGQKT